MNIDQRYVDRLEQENNWLREKIAELEGILGMRVEVPLLLGLTASEAKVVGILTKRELVTKEQFMQMLYVAQAGSDAEIKIIDVFICKARIKLEKFDIKIETVWARGYRMNPENKAKLAALLRAERGLAGPVQPEQRTAT